MKSTTMRSRYALRRSASTLALSAMLMPVAPLAAQAQSQPQPTAAEAEQQTAATTDEQGVADIVVTAQFREQNLQDVPIAISAVSGEQLAQRSVVDLVDVARAVPNVEMTAGNSGFGVNTNQAFVRGLGQADFLTTFEPRVGFYIDDVYFATTFGAVFDVLDLERVEVLRGPQGTLFGRNSVGGAIRIISRKPQGDGSGYAELTAGTYNRYQLRGAYDFSIVQDSLMARVVGSARGQDGWVDLLDYKCANPTLGNNNVGGLGQGPTNRSCKRGTLGGTRNYNFRGSLRWVASPSVEVLLQGDYVNEDSESAPEIIIDATTALINPETGIAGGGPSPGGAFPASNDNGLARYLRGLGTSYYGFDVSTDALREQVVASFESPDRYSTYARYGNQRVGYRNDPEGDLESYGASLTVDADLAANLHLTSISAYREYEGRFTQSLLAIPVEEVANGVSNRQFTQEVRLLGSAFGDLVDFTLGGFYIDNKNKNPARVQTEGFLFPLDFFSDDTGTLKAYALFGAVDVHPLPGLTLSGGLRYSNEKKTYTFVRDYSPSGLSAINFTFEGRNKDDRFNPRLAISYEATDDINLYASYSTGFTASAFNGRPFGPTSVFALQPEDVKSYEVGVKTQLLDRRVRLNAAAYHTDFGAIVGTVRGGVPGSPCSAPGTPFCNANIGDADIDGFEAELQAQPIDNLLVSANFGYTKFEYVSLLQIVQGLTLDSPNTRVPKWNASGSVQYDFELPNGGTITPRVDLSYRSRIYYSTSRANVSSQQEPYTLVNARITYAFPQDDWSVSLAATNLFDKFYYTTLTDQRESFGFLSGTVARPREVFVTVRKNF